MLNKEQVFGMYIGSDIYFPKTETIQFLKSVNRYGEIIGDTNGVKDIRNNISDCQLILRPIKEMSEEETRIYDNLRSCETHYTLNKYDNIQSFEYLISIGICINPDWHDKGYVIYESEIKEK